jgi:hypothetical protein
MAKGELLVFLDADTILERSALRIIAQEFSRESAAGTLKGRPDIDRFQYNAIYFLKNLTHRTSFHRGSSGVIVCWKEHFIHCGGFDEALEIKENSELIHRLRQFGKYKYIASTVATTSMRRYTNHGLLKTIWLWWKLSLQSAFGDLRNRRYEPVR